jgi:hypothetical protein
MGKIPSNPRPRRDSSARLASKDDPAETFIVAMGMFFYRVLSLFPQINAPLLQ